MGKVITISASKGGIGKTTLCANLGLDLASLGFRVCLVDSEKDGSLLDYANRSVENLTVVDGYNKSIPKEIDLIYRSQFDYIIIDTAGTASQYDSGNFQETLNHKLIDVSDLLIVPFEPSPVSTRKMLRYFRQIEDMLCKSPTGLKAMVVINKAKKNDDYTLEAKRDLPRVISIPVAKTKIRDLKVFKRAEEQLMSVNEFDVRSDSALEMRLLLNEILAAMEC